MMSSDMLDIEDYESSKKILKHKPTQIHIPKTIERIIHKNNLTDISDVNERAKIFIRALYVRKLKSSSVVKYFNQLKPFIFQGTTIVPNAVVFDDNYSRNIQNRGYDINAIHNFIKFVMDNVENDTYKWPILISAYSGLRINEVCNLKMSHLHMLMEKKPIIPLKRKNNKDWEVIYYDEFSNIIKDTIAHNTLKYNLYRNKFIDDKLFPFTSQALHSQIRIYYTLANGEQPPLGFGLHSVRYYLATILYEDTKKIEIAQALLGHVRSSTTELYLRNNNTKREQELETLCTTANFFSRIKDVIQKTE
ncbi:integrase [Homarus gammarus nudivirus]|uniref:Integrase n=1 Tax=Homarus gammarus nudivirus TaxID=2509616 RepID=A0A411HB86_9VIRU|nr:integrase [Homarus gammarus nudivirus]QBB28647.1 integrase [Homarus gammarus nudivirus]